MSENESSSTIQNERLFKFKPAEIFAAFENPDLLSQWWGPKGFKNTFQTFEFKMNGHWVFTMHGPDGKDYPNESTFREISINRIVIEHIVLPKYTLTITFTAQGEQTLVQWNQNFENKTFAKNMKDFLNNANEENFDRLQVVLEK